MAAISLGINGVAGWRVLKAIEGKQLASVARDPAVQRSQTYFRAKLDQGLTAEQIVGDYKLLSVALGVFGLQDDLPNKAFIRKILESDLSDSRSLANRLGDKRYLRMAQTLRVNDPSANPAVIGQKVSDAYLAQQLQVRVGEGDADLRLALGARDQLAGFGGRTSTDKVLWYEVMANRPLRKVFEDAFGFGSNYGRLPVDRQLNEFMKASERVLGSASFKVITTPETVDRLITTFLAKSGVTQSVAQNRYSNALTLLSR